MKPVLILLLISLLIRLEAQIISNMPPFGTDSTLEVVSWILEWFPKVGNTTVDYVSQIIVALDADVIAIQEIDDTAYFSALLKDLPAFDGYCAYNGGLSLAYIFKKSSVNVTSILERFTSKDREFPRPPLELKIEFKGKEYVILNNHLKCCGNGYLNLLDKWDEETRRHDACLYLDQYIRNQYPDANVIVAGDMNDILTDNQNNNVFKVFMDDPAHYTFADVDIANGNSSGWSYPGWPSHLDHILLTNELFDDLAGNGAEIRTLKIEDYLSGGWSTYKSKISDHKPVAVRLNPNAKALSTGISASKPSYFSNFPNPFNKETTIIMSPATGETSIEIYDLTPKLLVSIPIKAGETSVVWDASQFAPGVYYAKLRQNGIVRATGRMMVL